VKPLPAASALAACALAAAGLAASTGCGYGFSQRYVAVGGAERIHVRAFENRSTEPDLGAVVTAALREELARRGADAGEGAPAVIEGEIRASEPGLTSAGGVLPPIGTTGGTTWRIGVELRARFTPGGGAPPLERTVRRESDYLGGGDPLETEGRRALALRRVAGEAARELLRALER
jgi:hypothetical protein